MAAHFATGALKAEAAAVPGTISIRLSLLATGSILQNPRPERMAVPFAVGVKVSEDSWSGGIPGLPGAGCGETFTKVKSTVWKSEEPAPPPAGPAGPAGPGTP